MAILPVSIRFGPRPNSGEFHVACSSRPTHGSYLHTPSCASYYSRAPLLFEIIGVVLAARTSHFRIPHESSHRCRLGTLPKSAIRHKIGVSLNVTLCLPGADLSIGVETIGEQTFSQNSPHLINSHPEITYITFKRNQPVYTRKNKGRK